MTQRISRSASRWVWKTRKTAILDDISSGQCTPSPGQTKKAHDSYRSMCRTYEGRRNTYPRPPIAKKCPVLVRKTPKTVILVHISSGQCTPTPGRTKQDHDSNRSMCRTYEGRRNTYPRPPIAKKCPVLVRKTPKTVILDQISSA